MFSDRYYPASMPDRIKQKTVVTQVMEEIRNLIASGAYSPGDKIPTEEELARQFGIGRSSIREAIKIFNYLGILESRAALGTFVQDRSRISSEALTWSLLLGSDELTEIIDIRGAIELWSLNRLADSLKANDPSAQKFIDKMQSIVDGMKDAADSKNRKKLREADYSFHLTVIESSHIPLFISIYEILRSFLNEEIKKSQDKYSDLKQIYREHNELLKTIKTGKKLKINHAYMAHIANIKDSLAISKKP